MLAWLLVAAAAVTSLYCRRHAHLAAPWRRVLQSRAALASLVVLLLLAALGLLDSLHFRARLNGSDAYSNEVLSVLDLGLGHLRAHREETYSAPFATRLYAKEQIETADGKSLRDFPRLPTAAGISRTSRGGRATSPCGRPAASPLRWGSAGWPAGPCAR